MIADKNKISEENYSVLCDYQCVINAHSILNNVGGMLTSDEQLKFNLIKNTLVELEEMLVERLPETFEVET